MHYIIFPQKDTTIYSKYPEINTGLDEILEITKEMSSSLYFDRGTWSSSSYYSRYDYVQSASSGIYYYAAVENIYSVPGVSANWKQFIPTSSNENSRILMKFDLSSVPGIVTSSAEYVYLNLYTCISRKIPLEYQIDVCPVSLDWGMGTGNFTEKSGRDGATWERRLQTTAWSFEGGDYYTTPTASGNFNFSTTDIRIDIKNIFSMWTGSSSNNKGIIIKRPDSNEDDYINYGSLKFYSMDTHTVYVPTLEILYNDYIYSTSSFYPINANGTVTGSLLSGSIDISMKDFKTSYLYDTTNRFKINLKEKYQIKTFYEQWRPSEIKYLQESSLYYSIRDAYTNRIIIPFSNYTKISLNSEGHYFDVNTKGLMPERFYKIIFKYINNSVDTYFDNQFVFKVVK